MCEGEWAARALTDSVPRPAVPGWVRWRVGVAACWLGLDALHVEEFSGENAGLRGGY